MKYWWNKIRIRKYVIALNEWIEKIKVLHMNRKNSAHEKKSSAHVVKLKIYIKSK